MEQIGQGAGDRPVGGRTAIAVLLLALPMVIRTALVALPVLALRALFSSREQPMSSLTDHQLADIGLTRADLARPHERPGLAELEIQRLLRGRDWR